MKWLMTIGRHYRRRWFLWTVVIVGLVICFWPMRRYAVVELGALMDENWMLPGGYFEADPEVALDVSFKRLRWEEEARSIFRDWVESGDWKPIEGVAERAKMLKGPFRATIVFRRHNLVFRLTSYSTTRREFDVSHDLIEVARSMDDRIRNYEGASWSIDTLANKLWQQDYKDRIRKIKLKWKDLLL